MAFAQEWNLTGRLFDKAAGSLPLEATEIIVSHLDGETISSGFSDNQGKFTFSLPSGKFVVRYRQLGDILKALLSSPNLTGFNGIFNLPISCFNAITLSLSPLLVYLCNVTL